MEESGVGMGWDGTGLDARVIAVTIMRLYITVHDVLWPGVALSFSVPPWVRDIRVAKKDGPLRALDKSFCSSSLLICSAAERTNRRRSLSTHRLPELSTFPKQYRSPLIFFTLDSNHAPGTFAPQHQSSTMSFT